MRQAVRAHGPALLFEKIRGYSGWRIVGGIFAGLERIKLALGVEELESVGWRIVSALWRQPPLTLREKFSSMAKVFEMGSYAPRRARRAVFEENVIEAARIDDLRRLLPGIRQYPKEPNPYLTYPLVILEHPETRTFTMSVYRVMVRERDLVVHWQLHKRGRMAHLEWVERREEAPIAIALSADPASLLAGASPVPYPMDKFLFAGVLRGEGIELFKLDNGVMVPASSEVVIEGYVTSETAEEGPFGDHWGYYDKPARRFPVVRVERIWLRSNPVLYVTSVGKPVLEDAYIGKMVERVFLPLLRTIMPEIVDINLPPEGVFQGIAIVSIRKLYPGHAKKVMLGLFGLGMLALTKIIIVVDHDINVHNIGEVLWAVAAHVDPQRDVVVIPHSHTDELDPATPIPGYGSKLGIDATRKLPEEYGGREWPEEVSVPKEIVEKVREVLLREGVLRGTS